MTSTLSLPLSLPLLSFLYPLSLPSLSPLFRFSSPSLPPLSPLSLALSQLCLPPLCPSLLLSPHSLSLLSFLYPLSLPLSPLHLSPPLSPPSSPFSLPSLSPLSPTLSPPTTLPPFASLAPLSLLSPLSLSPLSQLSLPLSPLSPPLSPSLPTLSPLSPLSLPLSLPFPPSLSPSLPSLSPLFLPSLTPLSPSVPPLPPSLSSLSLPTLSPPLPSPSLSVPAHLRSGRSHEHSVPPSSDGLRERLASPRTSRPHQHPHLLLPSPAPPRCEHPASPETREGFVEVWWVGGGRWGWGAGRDTRKRKREPLLPWVRFTIIHTQEVLKLYKLKEKVIKLKDACIL
ncbi:uncharacterized protein LOC134341565 [Mobula hypostoma]|uniref:uncharacterized protein LOC134341565 n=1 Tax=Mobula hypostoma TaxID=723540 RepID=UPI002FC3919A